MVERKTKVLNITSWSLSLFLHPYHPTLPLLPTTTTTIGTRWVHSSSFLTTFIRMLAPTAMLCPCPLPCFHVTLSISPSLHPLRSSSSCSSSCHHDHSTGSCSFVCLFFLPCPAPPNTKAHPILCLLLHCIYLVTYSFIFVRLNSFFSSCRL